MTRRLFRLAAVAALLLFLGRGVAAAQDSAAPGDTLLEMTLLPGRAWVDGAPGPRRADAALERLDP